MICLSFGDQGAMSRLSHWASPNIWAWESLHTVSVACINKWVGVKGCWDSGLVLWGESWAFFPHLSPNRLNVKTCHLSPSHPEGDHMEIQADPRCAEAGASPSPHRVDAQGTKGRSLLTTVQISAADGTGIWAGGPWHLGDTGTHRGDCLLSFGNNSFLLLPPCQSLSNFIYSLTNVHAYRRSIDIVPWKAICGMTYN